jgi:hypothetical protein
VNQWFSAGVECSGEKLQSTLNQDRILLNKCCALAKHWHTLRYYNSNTNKLSTTADIGTAAVAAVATVKATANARVDASVTAVDSSSDTSYETRGAVCDDDISSVLQVLSNQGVFGRYGKTVDTEQQQQQQEVASLAFDSLAAAATAMDNEQQVIFAHYDYFNNMH